MRKRLVAALIGAVLGSGMLSGAHAEPTVIRSFISSFDATKIVYNLFLPADASADHPVPIIFQTHGWGGAGQRSVGGFLKMLLDNDYAVITWDERGFGQSGGEAFVDDPGHEVRDASALVDLVARRADILKSAPNDPVMGMIGGSYAGGIQLALAAFDSRVDAIIPQITWHDLDYSLFPGGVQKLGFDELLYAAGLSTAATAGTGVTVGIGAPTVQDVPPTAGPQLGNYSADLHEIEVRGTVNGYADQDTLDWFRGRSMAGYDFGHPVHIPTMLEQGSTDALFTVNEAVQNFNDIAATGAPVKLILYCGGHVACPSNYKTGTQGDYMTAMQLKWFDKYLRGGNDDTGAAVDYLTNDGVIHSTTAFGADATSSSTVGVHGSAQLVSTGAKTSTINGDAANAGLTGIEAATPSDPRDPGTLIVPTGITGGQTIVGIPTATLKISGTGLGVHLFFKLVDREQDQVIDLQEAALRVENLSALQTISFDMVGVAYKVPDGHHVDLQVSTSSGAMSEYRGPALVDIDVTAQVPVQ